MGAPERKAVMEIERINQSRDTEAEQPVASLEAESPRDQLAWAQYLHDSQFFDFSSFSPKGLISPRGEPGGLADLGVICPSPLFSEQLKFLQSWSPRVNNSESGLGNTPARTVAPSPSFSDQLKFIQSLDLSRVSNSEGVSTSVTTSCESEGPCSSSDVKVGTSESTGSGAEAGKSRKRKSVERDEENVDDISEGDEMEDTKESTVNKSSRSKQQKQKGPKRLREPRYAIKTRTEVDIMEDGYKWRKYGQKPVKNSPHPRNYYRCTTANCPVRKRVERSTEDPGLVVTSYEGTHTHPKVNQPKRTSSGNFAPFEAAESLSDSLNQLQNRQQAAATVAAAPHLPQTNMGQLPNLFPGFPGWPSLMNRQAPPAGVPSLQDNVGLMMAYQIVRLQWELQAKAQQFMSYSAQGGFPSGLPKMNPFMDPLGFLQAQSQLPLPDMGMMNYGESSDSDPELDRLKFPKVPEALNSNSLLARRAAQRTGSPLNPNMQSAMKMQQLMAQAMAGLHQAALDQQESLGEGADQERRS